MTGRCHISLVALGLLWAVWPADAADGVTPSLESRVKGAFLAKFPAYVDWPPAAIGSPEDPIEVCIIGRDPFGPQLDQVVEGQRVDSHPLVLHRLSSTAAAAGCKVAFLGGSGSQGTSAMKAALRGKPILTVTDATMGAERGIVHFILKEGRVRFLIDDAEAAREKLAISARLLSLALSVKPRAPQS